MIQQEMEMELMKKKISIYIWILYCKYNSIYNKVYNTMNTYPVIPLTALASKVIGVGGAMV